MAIVRKLINSGKPDLTQYNLFGKMGQEQFSRLAGQGPENPEKPTCKNRRENEPLVAQYSDFMSLVALGPFFGGWLAFFFWFLEIKVNRQLKNVTGIVFKVNGQIVKNCLIQANLILPSITC